MRLEMMQTPSDWLQFSSSFKFLKIEQNMPKVYTIKKASKLNQRMKKRCKCLYPCLFETTFQAFFRKSLDSLDLSF